MNEHYTTERRRYAKRASAIDCLVTFADLSAYPKIERCYRSALDAFLGWLEGERLQALCDKDAFDRSGGKRSRLRQTPEQWRFSLTARLTDERYLSLCLSVTGGGEGQERRFTRRRVWDVKESILCPLTRFLPSSQARKYDKWAYSLEDDRVIVCKRGKMHKIITEKLSKSVKR